MDENLLYKFKEYLRTREDLITILADIDQAQALVFKKKGKLSERLIGSVSERFIKVMESLEEEGKLPANPNKQAEFLAALKDYLSSLKTVKITLAFNPGEEFLTKIQDYLEGCIGERPILDILFREGIIAGLTIEYRGLYRDYSAAKKLSELVKEQNLNLTA